MPAACSRTERGDLLNKLFIIYRFDYTFQLHDEKIKKNSFLSKILI